MWLYGNDDGWMAEMVTLLDDLNCWIVQMVEWLGVKIVDGFVVGGGGCLDLLDSWDAQLVMRSDSQMVEQFSWVDSQESQIARMIEGLG